MEAARAAIHNFTSKRGHRTDVDETVRPAVVSETVKPARHEEITEAVDREVHQHHYHTTVQPIQHQEVLPEQHQHNLLPIKNKEINHENETETQRRVAAELGKFKDTSVTQATQYTQAHAPVVTGEHVHHHVHETVQPIIHKETIQPEVVHTTIPIHETHVVSSTHHGLSALPTKTLDEFKRAGGILDGTTRSSHEEYDGAPRPYNEKLSTTFDKLGLAGAGAGAAGVGTHKSNRTHDSGVGGLNRRGSDSSFSSSDEEGRRTGVRRSKNRGGIGSRVGGGIGSQQQGGISDKMNPRTDADRDGRAGVMD